MDDAQLLEAAAKAAGLTYRDDLWNGGHARNPDGLWVAWSPLESDADALRLAVRLGLAVSVEYQVGSTSALWGPPMGTVREQHGDDTYAATRRAIVRAAAAIGAKHG